MAHKGMRDVRQGTPQIDNANIMKSTRLEVVHLVRTKYRAEYEAAFPALDPNLSNPVLFPPVGRPGHPNGVWETEMTLVEPEPAVPPLERHA